MSSAEPGLDHTAHRAGSRRAHVIVLGNEKGGSGKSTTAMHLIVALLAEGRSVGSIDLDARQGTLSRYVANRKTYAEREAGELPLPEHVPIPLEEGDRLEPVFADLAARHDIVVIDCPGSDTALSRRGHALADTLITPLNDSFIDFDVLAHVDPDTLAVQRPSHYAVMVWEQRKQRALERRPAIDWVVLRNRLSTLDARNKQHIATALQDLAKRIGFRLVPGFGERVIFRELFPKGLTLLDLRDYGGGLSLSHVAARQEIRALVTALNLPARLPEPAVEATQSIADIADSEPLAATG